jgi:hypothetical protein
MVPVPASEHRRRVGAKGKAIDAPWIAGNRTWSQTGGMKIFLVLLVVRRGATLPHSKEAL